MAENTDFSAFGERRIGRINWLGVATLYKKEVLRFTNIYLQTIGAPMITTLLFFTVFSLAVGSARPAVAGVEFVRFLAPGLIMMSVLQNAFANTGSSLLVAKVQGNIVDSLMPPLSASELTFAYALGGATRGLAVATSTAIALSFFVDLRPDNVGIVLVFALLGSLMMSMMGIIAGVWAEKFDHMAAITNFIIMPLTFLSGTFYSISLLPEVFQTISHANPFFYLIDGFRAGFIGHADSNLWVGAAYLLALNVALAAACYTLFRTGWRLKA